MNKEQLEASRAIIELSKRFCDQMRKTMDRVGLLGEGYSLELVVQPARELLTGSMLLNSIEINNGHCDDSFCTFKYGGGKGWKNLYEPETYTESESDGSCGDQESGAEGSGEGSGKPFAPDGLWLSADYDSDPVQDWRPDVT